MPRITVGLPVYNCELFVVDAVESVLAQTFQDWELIISDHSSTDNTWALLQQYGNDDRIKLVQIPGGGGAVTNWNAVTELATGEYFKLLCADDTLLPTCLEEQSLALDRHPSAVMATARRRIIDVQGLTLLPARGLGGLRGLVSGKRAIRNLVLWGANTLGEPSTTLIRTEALRQTGGWVNDFPYLLDQMTYMHMLQRGDLYALGSVLATFRLSGQQGTVAHQRTAHTQMRGAAAWALERHFVSRPEYVLGLAALRKTVFERALAYRLWQRRLR